MLTEFHGEAVAGGTYPALIWKSFMERALPYLERERDVPRVPQRRVPGAAVRGVVPVAVVNRGGRSRDNGGAERLRVAFFPDRLPRRTADCKPNEVEVRRSSASHPVSRGPAHAQPLTPRVVVRRPSRASGSASS